MLNDNFLAKEARRLFTLPFPPQTEEAKKAILHEYVIVLQETAESKEHAVAVIDWIIRHVPRCPSPSEVFNAAKEIKAPDKAKAPLGCEKCQGSGYVHFTKMVRIAGMDPYEGDFSKPCDCALGQFIQPEYDKRRNKAPGSFEALG